MQWKLKKSSLQLFCKMIELWLDPYSKAKTSEKTNSYYDYTTKLTFDLRTFSTYLCFSESWKYMPKAAKRHQYFEWGPVLQNREFLLLRYNVPINSKVQHPPLGNPPGIWTFEDWCVQIPSPRGKKAIQMPHQLVLNCLSSKTNLVFNQTLYMPFRERYAVMTPSNVF